MRWSLPDFREPCRCCSRFCFLLVCSTLASNSCSPACFLPGTTGLACTSEGALCARTHTRSWLLLFISAEPVQPLWDPTPRWRSVPRVKSCWDLEWMAEARWETHLLSRDLLSREWAERVCISLWPFRKPLCKDVCSFVDVCFFWFSSFCCCSTKESWISQDVLSTHGQFCLSGSWWEVPDDANRVPFNVLLCFSHSRCQSSADLSLRSRVVWGYRLVAFAWLTPVLLPGNSRIILFSTPTQDTSLLQRVHLIKFKCS